MVPNADREDTETVEVATDALTAYEDGEYYVIRDEEEPEAWIRSDLVRPLSD